MTDYIIHQGADLHKKFFTFNSLKYTFDEIANRAWMVDPILHNYYLRIMHKKGKDIAKISLAR